MAKLYLTLRRQRVWDRSYQVWSNQQKQRCVMDGRIEFRVQELELQTILELRARCVHLLERAEFQIERGNRSLGEVLIKLAARTPKDVESIVSRMIRDWAKIEDLKEIYSEMYERIDNLQNSVTVWSEISTRGSENPFELIEELVDEVNICFTEESE